jgi:hypothetical protein
MRRTRFVALHSALLLCGVVALSGCAAKYSQVPPRLDLTGYGRVALATFTAEDADAAAGTLATERFAEALLAGQRVELLELGSADTAWRALADSAGAPAVFVGELTFARERPRGSISHAGLNVRSTVTAALSVRLVSTESGGTLWRSSSERRGTVGHVAVNRIGMPTMSMRDRDEAYGELVRDLVDDVTRDLRESWVRQ